MIEVASIQNIHPLTLKISSIQLYLVFAYVYYWV